MSLHRLCSIVLFAIFICISFSSNPPQGRTGGPGERTCADIGCHSGFTAFIDGHLRLVGLPETIQPGSMYPLHLQMIVDRGSPARGGFQMMSLSGENDDTQGFSDAGESSTISQSNLRSYFEHDPALQFDGMDTLTYSVNWTLNENIESDHIIFYAAANFANGNGGTSGDQIVTWSDTFVVQNNTIDAIATIVADSCGVSDNGAIFLSITGGLAPYRYQWSSGDTTASVVSLTSGTYTVTIKDSAGDSIANSYEVIEQADTIRPEVLCISDTLTIFSCTPFSYPLPTATDDCSEVNIKLIEGLGRNQSFHPGLHLEVYEASDQSGNTTRCTIYINNAVIIDPDIVVNDIPCYHDETGSVSAVVSGSNPPFTISMLQDGQDINALPIGAHTLVITDNTGCVYQEEIEIRKPDSLVLEIVEIIQPINSNSGDGEIKIRVSGGSPPYSFQWRTEDENFSEDKDLRLLFPGKYIIEVKDSRDCTITSDTITLDAITRAVDPSLSNALSVFPNPVEELLQIQVHGGHIANGIQIFSIDGRLVYSEKTFHEQLKVENLASGIFYLVVNFGDLGKGLVTFYKR